MCRSVRDGWMCRDGSADAKRGTTPVVVDATHPYATAVSENVRMACKAENMPYLRYLRDAGGAAGSKTPDAHQSTSISGRDVGTDSSITWVNSAAEAATYLETQSGNIFLTTGSKELHVFTERISDLGRLFIRVLPSASVITECRNLGMEGKQICAMQGPFSAEMNIAMLKQTDAAISCDEGYRYDRRLSGKGAGGTSAWRAAWS